MLALFPFALVMTLKRRIWAGELPFACAFLVLTFLRLVLELSRTFSLQRPRQLMVKLLINFPLPEQKVMLHFLERNTKCLSQVHLSGNLPPSVPFCHH